MQKVDEQLLTELARREPRSTAALSAVFSTRNPRHVRVVRAGSSLCVLVRREPFVWFGYPQLIDTEDSRRLAEAIDRTPVVGLDGHPEDMDPLIPHLTRVGETERFRTMIVPADQCHWTPSGPETRMALPLDLDALDSLFSDYEVRFVHGKRLRQRYLRNRVAEHAVVVHPGPGGIDGAILMGALTPQFLVIEHLRVHPGSRGQGISWALVSRVVEIAQACSVGLVFSLTDQNPMSMPENQGWIQRQPSVNLRLPDRVPGERSVKRLAIRVSRKLAG